MGLTTKQKTEDVMLFSRQWLNYEKNQFFVLVKKKKIMHVIRSEASLWCWVTQALF